MADVVTPEEAQALLDAAMEGTLELDGEQRPESEDQPTTQEQPKAVEGGEQPEQPEPEGAPIASKSGTYTIPYSKLEEAREKAKAAEAENARLKAQLEQLTAQQQANLAQAQDAAQARAEAGQQQTTADANLQVAQQALSEGVDASVFGDFSEEALAKGIQTLIERGREQILSQLRAEQEKVIAPLKQAEQQKAAASHYDAIYAKHPDANEIVQSEQFAQWQQSLPTFMRAGVQEALSAGTTEQVIEVFDTFKAQTNAPKAQGAAKAPEVQKYVPNSLSEVAGAPHQDVVQQTLAAADNPNALLERMENMTPEQIDRILNAI